MKISISLLIILTVFSVTVSGQARRRAVASNLNSGYANFNEIAGGYGLGGTTLSSSKYYYGATTTHGYQLNIYGLNVNRSFFAGLSSGALFYDKNLLIPLTLNPRFIWNTGLVSPYISGDGGFIFSPDDVDKKTMVLIKGGGGIQLRISNNFYATFGSGLGVHMGLDGRRSFIEAKIGVGFKGR